MQGLSLDVLVTAGLLKPSSYAAKSMRAANALVFRVPSAVVIIGRSTEALLLGYRRLTHDRICFVVN
jgi:hypothetical protein